MKIFTIDVAYETEVHFLPSEICRNVVQKSREIAKIRKMNVLFHVLLRF